MEGSKYYQSLQRDWNMALGAYKENFGMLESDDEEVGGAPSPVPEVGNDIEAEEEVAAADDFGGVEIASVSEGGEDVEHFSNSAFSPPPFRKVPTIQDEEEEEIIPAVNSAELKNINPVRFQQLMKHKLKRMGTVFNEVDKQKKEKFYSGILKKLSAMDDSDDEVESPVLMAPPAIKKVASIGIEQIQRPLAAPPRMSRQKSMPGSMDEYARVMKSLDLPLQEALVEIFQGYDLDPEQQLKAINDYFDDKKVRAKKNMFKRGPQKGPSDMLLKCRWCEMPVKFCTTVPKKRLASSKQLLEPIKGALESTHFPSEKADEKKMKFLNINLGGNLAECLARVLLEKNHAAIIEGFIESEKYSDLEDAIVSLYDICMEKSVCDDPCCLASHEFVHDAKDDRGVLHMKEQVLDCGHWNVCLANQASCLVEGCKNCPKNLHSHLDDYCFCFTDACRAQPCVIFPCGHVAHYECISTWVGNGPLRKYLEFGFLNCPLCKTPLMKEPFPTASYNSGVMGSYFNFPKQPHSRNELLDKDMEIWLKLKKDTEKLCLKQANDEAIWNDDNYKLWPDLLGYAMHIYAVCQCFKCKEAYFSGQKSCFGDFQEHEEQEELDRSSLICPGCRNAKHYVECPTHGKEFMLFKCKYCCDFATWDCIDLAHFCNPCHSSVWSLANNRGHRYDNKKQLWEYPQCPDIKADLEKIRKACPDYDINEVKAMAEELMCSGKSGCKMKRRHKANGFEWGFGCQACSDQQNMD